MSECWELFFFCLYLTVFNLHPVGFRCFEFPFSKLLHSKPSSALNRLWNTEWFHIILNSIYCTYFLLDNFSGSQIFSCFNHYSKVTWFILYSDCGAAGLQRSAVLLWPQLWSPIPPIWRSWNESQQPSEFRIKAPVWFSEESTLQTEDSEVNSLTVTITDLMFNNWN